MSAINIVFAGTPAFTLPALDAIHNSNHNLVAVYTQPDRPKGRGRKLEAPAAKVWAQAQDIPVYQPLHLKDKANQDELRDLKPDVMVVIAYGLILPREVLAIPRFGCINVHPSLLPAWRGATPIQSSLLHGNKTTGVTIMQMDEGMDTGPILNTVTYDIPAHTTSGELHDILAELSCTPLLEVLDRLASDTPLTPTPQDNSDATYSKKIAKQDAKLDWTNTAIEIEHKVCAFNPWPIAYTNAADEVLRIHEAIAQNTPSDEPPGTIVDITKKGITVATGENTLQIKRLQFTAGKVMSVSDWLNGNKKNLYTGLVLQ